MSVDIVVAGIGAAGSALVGWLGWLGGRRDSRQKELADKESARREAEALANSRWDTMLEAQREGFEALLEPLREETKDLRGQVGELREEVVELRRELTHRDSIISTLVAHIRQLLADWRRYLPTQPIPTPPDTIAHLI